MLSWAVARDVYRGALLAPCTPVAVHAHTRGRVASPRGVTALPLRLFVADIHYAEEPVSDFVRAVAEACLQIHATLPHGDILAFLPGSEEIDNAVQAILVPSSPSES